MAGPYYVDDGGSATAPYDTWAKAATSLSALDDAVTFASGEIIYIGHDHVCQFTHSGQRTITGPAAGVPCYLISATSGSDPVTYAKSTTDQVDTTEGAYNLIFSGSWAIYGVRVKSGGNVTTTTTSGMQAYLDNCTFAVAASSFVLLNPIVAPQFVRNLTIDLTADGTTNRSGHVLRVNDRAIVQIQGLTFVNAGYRTGTVIGDYYNGGFFISGADFSGFTNGTVCEIVSTEVCWNENFISNSKTAATWTPFRNYNDRSGGCEMYNVGPADAPTSYLKRNTYGDVVSSTAIYRSTGATIEGDATSWLVTTTAAAVEGAPFLLPWIYGTVGSTGAKTFDIYITNDTADFTDAEVWMEVEYLATSDVGTWTLATDQRATIVTTAAAQTDDTTSTWYGAGPSFTYKQMLSVGATIGETGQYRARVCVGKASIASSRYFYIDCKANVT